MWPPSSVDSAFAWRTSAIAFQRTRAVAAASSSASPGISGSSSVGIVLTYGVETPALTGTWRSWARSTARSRMYAIRRRPSTSTTASTESSHSWVSTGSVSGACVLMPLVFQQRRGRGPTKGLDGPGVRVAQVVEARVAVARRAEKPRPRVALVGDDAELPDAEGGPVRPVEGPGVELRVGVAVLRPDGLPQLVLVLPRAEEEEVEPVAAAVEDHEPERAAEPQLAEARRVGEAEPGEVRHHRLDRLVRRGYLVPLEHGVAEGDALPRARQLRGVHVVGVDNDPVPLEQRHSPPPSAGVKSITQFVSHVRPPSSENACSHRGVGVVMPDQMKRTRIGRPLNTSSPWKTPASPSKCPKSGGSSSPGRRESAQ